MMLTFHTHHFGALTPQWGEEESIPLLTTTTLAVLVISTATKPPVVGKLDVQGAELAALRGAGKVPDTGVIICECDMGDFQAPNAAFGLEDLTLLQRRHHRSLGWFYPVDIGRNRAAKRPGK